jgi:hypothetical protein
VVEVVELNFALLFKEVNVNVDQVADSVMVIVVEEVLYIYKFNN